jgi:hypothetical protein
MQTFADTCDAGGMCVDGGDAIPCDPYVCDAAGMACLTTCMADTDCATGNYCNAINECVAKKNQGQVCGGANECQSGFCPDGRCCGAACDGMCENCGNPQGNCNPIMQGTVDPQCADPNTTCDAMQMCKLPNGAACMDGTECASGNCLTMVCSP